MGQEFSEGAHEDKVFFETQHWLGTQYSLKKKLQMKDAEKKKKSILKSLAGIFKKVSFKYLRNR